MRRPTDAGHHLFWRDLRIRARRRRRREKDRSAFRLNRKVKRPWRKPRAARGPPDEKKLHMEEKTREAAAIMAALMLARLAHLRFDCDVARPVLPLHGYLHASAAKLMLVPAISAPADELLDDAVTALGADALVVHAAGRDAADINFKAVMRGAKLFRTARLRLWLGSGAPAHFIPDDPTDTSIALLRVGLRGCEVPPWNDEDDRRAGLALGLAELTRVLEGR